MAKRENGDGDVKETRKDGKKATRQCFTRAFIPTIAVQDSTARGPLRKAISASETHWEVRLRRTLVSLSQKIMGSFG